MNEESKICGIEQRVQSCIHIYSVVDRRYMIMF